MALDVLGDWCSALALARGVDLDIVAINDRGDAAINAHLFQFDSTYEPFPGRVKAERMTGSALMGNPLRSIRI